MTHRKSDAWHARHCPTFIIDDAPYVFDGLYWSVRLRASSEGIERENPRGMLLIVRGSGMSGLGPKRTGETRRPLADRDVRYEAEVRVSNDCRPQLRYLSLDLGQAPLNES